jgi:methyl coenzyme M reductase alpha subunit
MPSRQPPTMSFPVPGVHLVPDGTNCSLFHCQVKLRNLTRDHSGGAYRCEVSSEAPTFRLAAKTHNVTVAGWYSSEIFQKCTHLHILTYLLLDSAEF